MSIKIIQERLNTYRPINELEELNALKEITQEIALSGLARAGFFKNAAFQGGTCLRILYGLNRFSEDLDFALLAPNENFQWKPYLASLETELESYGYKISVEDRSKLDNAVKVGFLKDQSIGKILVLNYPAAHQQKSLKIKLEIDTNPPLGALIEQKYLDFPLTIPISTHDLSSLFAGKCHALLCRQWEKGRDWFDFLWYVSRKAPLNLALLTNAIDQFGPWRGKKIQVSKEWCVEKLREKILDTDWNKQKGDIERFLKQSNVESLQFWNNDFFLERLEYLSRFWLMK
jgi:hypothetical protein